MNQIAFLALSVLPLLAGCGRSPASNPSGMDTTNHAQALPEGEAHVQCGCSIPSIGACGEYIEHDGHMLELVLPEGVDLGPMPFCGKDGLVADVEGEVVDGKFIASAFSLKK